MQKKYFKEEQKINIDNLEIYQDRVKYFFNHWNSIDSNLIGKIYKQETDFELFEQLILFIIGIKPVFSSDNSTAINHFDDLIKNLIPPELQSDTLLILESYVCSKKQVIRVIKTNKKYFNDFDLSKINDVIYLEKYLKKFFENFETFNEENNIIKAGLLFGFDRDSVINYGNLRSRKKLVKFNYRGMIFKIDPDKKGSLEKKLDYIFNKLGIEKFLKKITDEVSYTFNEIVKNSTDYFELYEQNGVNFLFFTSPDHENFVLHRSFVLLSNGCLDKNIIDVYFQEFSEKFKCHFLLPTAKTINNIDEFEGIFYFEYLKLFEEIASDANKILYINFLESATKLTSFKVCSVDKANFLNWVFQLDKKLANRIKKII